MTCCRPSRRRSAAAASARWCGSRSPAGMNPKLREQLIEALKLEEREVYEIDGPARPRRPLGHRRRRRATPSSATSPGHPVTQPRLQTEDEEAVDIFGRSARATCSSTTPTTPSLLGRALRRAGGRRPRRAGDQADRVPDQRRLAAGPLPDPRLGAGQAGGLHGRAEGPLRRGGEHPVGEVAGGGGRPRRLRHPRAEDPRQGDPRRPPGGRQGAPLRPHRHRQLQPEDRPALHRPGPVHRRPGDRRRRRRDVQLPDRLRAPRRVPQGAGLADDDAASASSRRSSDGRGPSRRPACPDRAEDELAGRRAPASGRSTRPRGGGPDRAQRARHLLPAPGGAGGLGDHPGQSRSSAASSSTLASTHSSAARRPRWSPARPT